MLYIDMCFTISACYSTLYKNKVD